MQNYNDRRRIGILGGSFNPAHSGHLHISELALKNLDLDEVWWLVSIQNPLKSRRSMANFVSRLDSAKRVASINKKIVVKDLEANLKSNFTVDTLSKILDLFSKNAFIWIMGADNLLQITQWKDWLKIFDIIPIAVFARPPYNREILRSDAATYFVDKRYDESLGSNLINLVPPAWIYFDTALNPISSTEIRNANYDTCKWKNNESSIKTSQ